MEVWLSTNSSRLRLLLIKLAFATCVAILLRHAPEMIAQNVADGAVMGRYTYRYSVILAGYFLWTLFWTGVGIAVVVGLNLKRVMRIDEWRGRTRLILAGAMSVIAVGIIAADGVIYFSPASFSSFSKSTLTSIIPQSYLFICIGFVLLMHNQGSVAFVQTIGRRLNLIGSRICDHHPWIQRLTTSVPISGIALAGICILFVLTLLSRDIWAFPLFEDASIHIYLGQRLYAGGRPYSVYLHFQPPGYPAFVWLWALLADLTNLPMTHIARSFAMLLGIGALAVIYKSGKIATNSPFGGLFAAAVLLGSEPLLDVVLKPQFKVVVMFVCYLGILLAQRRHWFWAGVGAGCTVVTWIPGALFSLSVLVTIFFVERADRRRAFLYFLTGAAVVVLATIGVLALLGSLDDAYRYVIVGTWLYMTDSGGGFATHGTLLKFTAFAKLISAKLAGNTVFVLLGLVGFPLLVWHERQGRTLVNLPLIILFPLLIAGLILNSQGSGDVLILVPLLALFAAWLCVTTLDWIKRNLALSTPVFQSSLYVIVFLFMLVYGLNPASYEQPPFSLAEQQAFADELNTVLMPDQTVQAFDHLWFPVLTEQPNATRFAWISGKTYALLEAEGHAMEDAVLELEEANPTIVMYRRNDQNDITYWLDRDYTFVGKAYWQGVYVRNDEDALIDLLSD
jgi:hypothetical protein